MRNCDSARFLYWRGVRLTVFAIAGLTALTLSGAAGYAEQAENSSLPVVPAPVLGTYPDPGNDLTDPGIPGNPPPPAPGVDAPEPGSPDGGVSLQPAGPGFVECVLRPNEDVRECFRPTVGERYSIGAAGSNPYAFKVVESAASDGTVLRTTAFGGSETHVVSFPANTIVTIANNSPYPRNQDLKVDFTLLGTSDDFLCNVPIHNPYFPDDWRNHTQCTWTGLNSWLALFTNYGDRPVDVNEWYGNARHGRTELLPGKPTVIPLHSRGAFYVGVGGPPGPAIKVSVTDYQIANEFKEMWVRDRAQIQPGDNTIAVNLSPYPIRLSWSLDGVRGERTLLPNERVETPFALGLVITGEKNYGNGEVARVLFLEPGGGGIDAEYHIKVPPGSNALFPLDIVDLLANKYRSVKIYNRGPNPVGLTAWFIPFFVPVGFVQVPVGETRILPLFDIGNRLETTMITGLVSPPTPGVGTTVQATEWVPCGFNNCNTPFAPALNALTGSATGLDAGQVHLRLQGRLTLARSAGNPNLGRASVDLIDLLDEAGAAGELVAAAEPYGVHLVPSGSRGATTVFSEQPPPGARPVFRLEVTPRAGRDLDFTLNVARSILSGEPQSCSPGQPSVTSLVTRFFIYDKRGRPLNVATTKPWECVGYEPQEPNALLLQ